MTMDDLTCWIRTCKSCKKYILVKNQEINMKEVNEHVMHKSIHTQKDGRKQQEGFECYKVIAFT